MGNTKSIQEKAMLMDINISQWSARKLDRKVTQEVNKSHNASDDAGRYNKMLVSDPAIKELASIARDARGHFFKHTLPWQDTGSRILPAVTFMQLAQDMGRFKASFESKVHEIILNYNEMIRKAKTRLNGMFNMSDYPNASQIEKYYSFDVRVLPVPHAGDFRVELQEHIIDRIKDSMAEKEKESLELATQDLWKRVYDAVENVATQMSKPKPIVFDSLIGNVKELCKILPSLNINDDAGLDSVLADLESGLATVDTDSLKGDSAHGTRRDVAKEASGILSRINQLKGGG